VNALPNFQQAIVEKGVTSRAWYQFFQQLWKGTPPGSEAAITVEASPFKYTAAQRGFVIVNGGTVILVQFNRTTTNYVTGQTAGCFPLSAGDSLIVTYTGVPTMTFVPQ
jgi:hypothetical protein